MQERKKKIKETLTNICPYVTNYANILDGNGLTGMLYHT